MNSDAGPSCCGHQIDQTSPLCESPLSTESGDCPGDDLCSSGEAVDGRRVQPEIFDTVMGFPPEVLRGKYSTVPGKRPKPGLDRSLPPISKIEDIFDDMVTTADRLGFGRFLQHIGSRDLRVATMCSGTESPLLALEMIVDGMYIRMLKFPHIQS